MHHVKMHFVVQCNQWGRLSAVIYIDQIGGW